MDAVTAGESGFLCQDGTCWITPEHTARRRRERFPELAVDPTVLYTPLDFGRDGGHWLVDAVAPSAARDLGDVAVKTHAVSVDVDGAALTLLVGPIGAPATVATLESAIALGARRVLFLGICGSLQPDLRIGDLVLVDSTIREEGTSYHYLPPGEPAEPSPALLGLAESLLTRDGAAYRRGTVWTTDAPFRETRTKVQRLASQGVLGVEMETSAVYALARFRSVEALSLQVVSDQLVGEEWTGIRRDTFLDRCHEAARLLARLAGDAGPPVR
jgi:uridine phosphorylase